MSLQAAVESVVVLGGWKVAERLEQAASFAERYGALYAKAVTTLTGGLDEALTYTAFPSSGEAISPRPTD